MRMIKIFKKSIAIIGMAALMLFMNFQPAMAKENVTDSVIQEFIEKKEKGLDVYELLDEAGNIIGYYEPYSETNSEPNEGIMPLYSSTINWTIGAGRYKYGTNQYTLSSGDTINVKIEQSRTGKSYLTFQNRDTNSSLRFEKTETDDGWNGTIKLAGINKAVWSFGIENASDNTITYSGTYDL